MNFYLQQTERESMVEILCPHCEEEIELDDDVIGEFACPYCEGEFEWGMPEERIEIPAEVQPVLKTTQSRGMLGWAMLTLQTALGGSFFVGGGVSIAVGIFGILTSSAAWSSLGSFGGGEGLGGMGILVFMALIALGFLVSVIFILLGLFTVLAGLAQLTIVASFEKKRS
jgi:hypothetical protein